MAKFFKEVGGPTNSGNFKQGGQTYSVVSTTETLGEMQSQEYLNEFAEALNVRDTVILSGSDGTVLTHITSISVAGVVVANRDGVPEKITVSGDIDPLSVTTEITAGGSALTLGLQDGIPGHKKNIVMVATGGGVATLSPNLFADGASMAFNAANDNIELLWATGIGWVVIANQSVVIA